MTRDCRSWECRSLFAGICLRGSVEMFLIVVDVVEVCLSDCLVIVGEFVIDSSLSLLAENEGCLCEFESFCICEMLLGELCLRKVKDASTNVNVFAVGQN